MSLLKAITLACMIGVGISGAGAGLMTLGGWGPCGPASGIAAIGGFLNMVHVDWLLALFPGLEPLTGRMIPDWVLVLVWPALVWSVLAFLVLAFWRWVRKDEPQLP